jgi:hypothetical protein
VSKLILSGVLCQSFAEKKLIRVVQKKREKKKNAMNPSFSWKEDWWHVELEIPLDGDIAAKNITVRMQVSHLTVVLAGETKIDGELHSEIYPEESTWFIQDGALHLELCKKDDAKLWYRVFRDDIQEKERLIQPKKYSEMDHWSSEYRSHQDAYQFKEQVERDRKNPNMVVGQTTIFSDDPLF